MSKNIITIVSVILVILGSVFTYSYLSKGQEDTQFNILNLNKINNTASFLWIDERQEETVFYISGIEMEIISSNTNPYFEMLFNIKDITNNNVDTDGFSFLTNIGGFTGNKLRVSCKNLNANTEIEVMVKVNTNIVAEGNYFLDLQLNEGSFDLAEINNGAAIRLELEVNEKLHPLQLWLSILFVIFLLAICVWFFLLKKEYFPTFSKKGQLNISAPETSTIFLNKNARKLIIGNKLKEKENFFTKLFYGKIQYEYLNSDHSVIIKPVHDFKTKKIWYIISTTNSTVINISMKRYLNNGDKYVINTNNEELIFNYLNIKHI